MNHVSGNSGAMGRKEEDEGQEFMPPGASFLLKVMHLSFWGSVTPTVHSTVQAVGGLWFY